MLARRRGRDPPPVQPRHTVSVPAALTLNLITILLLAGEDAIRHLFSRGTHREFGYAAIIVMLIFYFLGAAWTGACAGRVCY